MRTLPVACVSKVWMRQPDLGLGTSSRKEAWDCGLGLQDLTRDSVRTELD